MTDQATLDAIKTAVEANDIVLFMKKSLNSPQLYSQQVITGFAAHG